MSSDSFLAALAALREFCSAQGEGSLVQGLSLEEGNVVFRALSSSGAAAKVAVAYDAYPRGAVVLAEEEAVARVNEDLQGGKAVLHVVVQKVRGLRGVCTASV